MYIARRRIDDSVMEKLRALADDPCNSEKLRVLGTLMDEYGFDIWDVLEEVVTRPLLPGMPKQVGGDPYSAILDSTSAAGSQSDLDALNTVGIPRYDLTLQYWAKQIQCILCRRQAISIWKELRVRVPSRLLLVPYAPKGISERKMELDEVLAGLSAFWGVPIEKASVSFPPWSEE